jgi:hypothetical protein
LCCKHCCIAEGARGVVKIKPRNRSGLDKAQHNDWIGVEDERDEGHLWTSREEGKTNRKERGGEKRVEKWAC